jgi:hypothetical protein
MSNKGYHEPITELSEETKDMRSVLPTVL